MIEPTVAEARRVDRPRLAKSSQIVERDQRSLVEVFDLPIEHLHFSAHKREVEVLINGDRISVEAPPPAVIDIATNKPVNVSVRKNGSGFAAFQQISGDYSDDCAAYVSQIFDASAGDYFDATCFHRGGSSFNANTNTCFGGYKLL